MLLRPVAVLILLALHHSVAGAQVDLAVRQIDPSPGHQQQAHAAVSAQSSYAAADMSQSLPLPVAVPVDTISQLAQLTGGLIDPSVTQPQPAGDAQTLPAQGVQYAAAGTVTSAEVPIPSATAATAGLPADPGAQLAELTGGVTDSVGSGTVLMPTTAQAEASLSVTAVGASPSEAPEGIEVQTQTSLKDAVEEAQRADLARLEAAAAAASVMPVLTAAAAAPHETLTHLAAITPGPALTVDAVSAASVTVQDTPAAGVSGAPSTAALAVSQPDTIAAAVPAAASTAATEMSDKTAATLVGSPAAATSAVQSNASLSHGPAPAENPNAPLFVGSNELGVTQCILPGVVGAEPVNMRLFLSACVEGANTTKPIMQLAGFVFVEGAWAHQYFWLQQSATVWKGAYTITSAKSRKTHPVQQYTYAWRNTPTKIFATFRMDDVDEEFFIQPTGFHHSCRFSVLSLTAPGRWQANECTFKTPAAAPNSRPGPSSSSADARAAPETEVLEEDGTSVIDPVDPHHAAAADERAITGQGGGHGEGGQVAGQQQADAGPSTAGVQQQGLAASPAGVAVTDAAQPVAKPHDSAGGGIIGFMQAAAKRLYSVSSSNQPAGTTEAQAAVTATQQDATSAGPAPIRQPGVFSPHRRALASTGGSAVAAGAELADAEAVAGLARELQAAPLTSQVIQTQAVPGASALVPEANASLLPPTFAELAHPSQPGSAEPAVYFVISPFYGIKAEHFVTLLMWHVQWHSQYGDIKYMMYNTEQLPHLVKDPRLQAMVRRGTVQVIEWREVSLRWPHPHYSHQILIYNHAVLARWNEDAYVVMADLDEFLATPERTTIPQVFAKCSASQWPGPVTSLEVDVHLGLCDKCHLADKLLEARGQSNVSSAFGGHARIWLNTREGAPHPLSYYNKWSKQQEPTKGKRHPKIIIRPHGISYVVVHWGGARKGYRVRRANGQCVKWLHMTQQLSDRTVGVPSQNVNSTLKWVRSRASIPKAWLWPLNNATVSDAALTAALTHKRRIRHKVSY